MICDFVNSVSCLEETLTRDSDKVKASLAKATLQRYQITELAKEKIGLIKKNILESNCTMIPDFEEVWYSTLIDVFEELGTQKLEGHKLHKLYKLLQAVFQKLLKRLDCQKLEIFGINIPQENSEYPLTYAFGHLVCPVIIFQLVGRLLFGLSLTEQFFMFLIHCLILFCLWKIDVPETFALFHSIILGLLGFVFESTIIALVLRLLFAIPFTDNGAPRNWLFWYLLMRVAPAVISIVFQEYFK